jgi:two-component system KDP operon response regulator KdpE
LTENCAYRLNPDGCGENAIESFDVGDFHVDSDARCVHVRGTKVRLPPKEFELFVYLARYPNRTLPNHVLLETVWGQPGFERPEYLRVYVCRLRRRLERDPSRPKYLLTENWAYRLNPNG